MLNNLMTNSVIFDFDSTLVTVETLEKVLNYQGQLTDQQRANPRGRRLDHWRDWRRRRPRRTEGHPPTSRPDVRRVLLRPGPGPG